ncbi:MAG: hypothetical protein FWH11_15040 [Micrococcales bacterium]|nr:hypothetical protein [Micrococcales bacterium]
MDIGERLWQHGLDVELDHGLPGGMRIPLVAGHPSLPGRFLVAVLTDDEAYVAEPSVRARDRLSADRLRALGWTVVRIWSAAAFLDPQAEVDRVRRALHAALPPELAMPPTRPPTRPEPVVPESAVPTRQLTVPGDLDEFVAAELAGLVGHGDRSSPRRSDEPARLDPADPPDSDPPGADPSDSEPSDSEPAAPSEAASDHMAVSDPVGPAADDICQAGLQAGLDAPVASEAEAAGRTVPDDPVDPAPADTDPAPPAVLDEAVLVAEVSTAAAVPDLVSIDLDAEPPSAPTKPRPDVQPGLPVGAYTDDELDALVEWLLSDGQERTRSGLAAEVRTQLAVKRRSKRFDSAVRAAVSRALV